MTESPHATHAQSYITYDMETEINSRYPGENLHTEEEKRNSPKNAKMIAARILRARASARARAQDEQKIIMAFLTTHSNAHRGREKTLEKYYA